MQLCVCKTKGSALKIHWTQWKRWALEAVYTTHWRQEKGIQVYYCDNSVSSDKIQIIYPLFQPKILRNKMCQGGAAQ